MQLNRSSLTKVRTALSWRKCFWNHCHGPKQVLVYILQSAVYEVFFVQADTFYKNNKHHFTPKTDSIFSSAQALCIRSPFSRDCFAAIAALLRIFVS